VDGEYNQQRPHQGRWCYGKNVPLVKQKILAA
jgi:hypothetical protein